MKKLLFFAFLIQFSGLVAQEQTSLFVTKKIAFTKDTIRLEKKSINNRFFRLIGSNKAEIDTTKYQINFKKGFLLFKKDSVASDSITIQYLKFPDFITKQYVIYDQAKIVPNRSGRLYSMEEEKPAIFKPFDGLNTSGSITRGVTIGNNQNAVVNSNLDLQITGKISDKVSLRASLQDSNLPIQNDGYSQNVEAFDQIFIELFSDSWNIRAGDLFLQNKTSKFLNFNKKVQGLSANFDFKNKTSTTNVFASGALVRGQYAKSAIVGQEGNQGPYKLIGANGALYSIIISGSENVFVNGILLKRGENNQYTIDYNAGEIIFTPLFPITSEMRIVVEYQFSDRNYSRFVSYFGTSKETKKWRFGANVYLESDLKNQPLQQSLSPAQVAILGAAGDNQSLMNASSAVEDSFSNNKILYKKNLFLGQEIYEFSNDSTLVLFSVKFSFLGANQGNYILKNSNAIGKIYEYIPPIAGIKQGSYEPIVPLIAPSKIELATVMGRYSPTEKTLVDFELGISRNDLNLFSDQNDTNNNGLAARVNFKQRLITSKWLVDVFSNFDFIQKDFKTVERLFTIEFNRDWNSISVSGNQQLWSSGLTVSLPQKGTIGYQFENLQFSKSYKGNRHLLNANFKLDNWVLTSQSSALKSDGTINKSDFYRSRSQAKYHFKKNWVGASLQLEDNKEVIIPTNTISSISQKFIEYGTFLGRGDSTKVYTEIGFLARTNDSLKNNLVQRVNQSQSYFLKSRLIQTTKRDLSIFVNYRNLKYKDNTQAKEPSLNSRIVYNDRFWDQMLMTTTAFETNSGTIAQQEFTYIEVAQGQGVYVWNDYNANNIQELQEFEIAPFIDLAKYVRVFLPNQIFIKTHQNKFSQSLSWNFLNWQNKTGFQKFVSRFYNQTTFSIDRKIKRKENNFDLNPFATSQSGLLGLNSAFRNSLFFNKGKQKHAVTYNLLISNAKNAQVIGAVENNISSNQLQYLHLLDLNWLLEVTTKKSKIATKAENFVARNYQINGYEWSPKISYLFSKNASWDLFYEFQNKENKLGELETLKQSQFGTNFTFSSSKKMTLNGSLSYFQNKFTGNQTTPAAFILLEGLQAGKNMVWQLLFQKNLTQFLDINFNYQGRKSPTSNAIHTGSVQLRAFF